MYISSNNRTLASNLKKSGVTHFTFILQQCKITEVCLQLSKHLQHNYHAITRAIGLEIKSELHLLHSLLTHYVTSKVWSMGGTLTLSHSPQYKGNSTAIQTVGNEVQKLSKIHHPDYYLLCCSLMQYTTVYCMKNSVILYCSWVNSYNQWTLWCICAH